MRARGTLRGLALVLLLAGCSTADSLVVVSVDTDAPLPDVALLHTVSMAGGQTVSHDVGGNGPFMLVPGAPKTFAVDVPASIGGAFSIHVEARDGRGNVLAQGDAQATLSPGNEAAVRVVLHVGGTDGGVVDLAPRDLTLADLATVDRGVPDLAFVDGGLADLGAGDLTSDGADLSVAVDGGAPPDLVSAMPDGASAVPDGASAMPDGAIVMRLDGGLPPDLGPGSTDAGLELTGGVVSLGAEWLSGGIELYDDGLERADWMCVANMCVTGGVEP